MEVYLYSGVQNLVEKSGVGRALRHQQIGENQVLIKRILKKEAADLTENGYRVAQERAIGKTGAQLREMYKGCMKRASRAELKTDAIKIRARKN